MATSRQKKALDLVVEYGGAKKPIIKSQILKEAGYSGATAITPQKVFESVGFLKLCDEAGLTDEFLAKALFDDIQAKPKNRKPELELAFKIKGKLSGDQQPTGTVNNFVFFDDNRADKIARRIIGRIQPDSPSEPESPR